MAIVTESGKYIFNDLEIPVEVGDTKQVDFYPQVKLKPWNNETNFSLRLSANINNASVIDDNNKIIWTSDNGTEAHMYQTHDGFEFEVIYHSKPTTNVVQFTINTKELQFFYQPELTQEEKNLGANRPENVIGSYAIYHASKKDNEYKTGKAFHIFRPKAIDAIGLESWCELNIDEINNILTVTVPQDYLDNASYPVIVDPTFGYTSQGATEQVLSYNGSDMNQAIVYLATAPTSTTIDSISIYVDVTNAVVPTKPVIWGGGTRPQSIITDGVGDPTSMPIGLDWKTLPYTTKPSVTSGTSYRLGFVSNLNAGGNVYTYYDSGGATAVFNYSPGINYTTPGVWDNISMGNNGRFSIYANYGGDTSVPRLPFRGNFEGVGQGVMIGIGL